MCIRDRYEYSEDYISLEKYFQEEEQQQQGNLVMNFSQKYLNMIFQAGCTVCELAATRCFCQQSLDITNLIYNKKSKQLMFIDYGCMDFQLGKPLQQQSCQQVQNQQENNQKKLQESQSISNTILTLQQQLNNCYNIVLEPINQIIDILNGFIKKHSKLEDLDKNSLLQIKENFQKEWQDFKSQNSANLNKFQELSSFEQIKKLDRKLSEQDVKTIFQHLKIDNSEVTQQLVDDKISLEPEKKSQLDKINENDLKQLNSQKPILPQNQPVSEVQKSVIRAKSDSIGDQFKYFFLQINKSFMQQYFMLNNLQQFQLSNEQRLYYALKFSMYANFKFIQSVIKALKKFPSNVQNMNDKEYKKFTQHKIYQFFFFQYNRDSIQYYIDNYLNQDLSEIKVISFINKLIFQTYATKSEAKNGYKNYFQSIVNSELLEKIETPEIKDKFKTVLNQIELTSVDAVISNEEICQLVSTASALTNAIKDALIIRLKEKKQKENCNVEDQTNAKKTSANNSQNDSKYNLLEQLMLKTVYLLGKNYYVNQSIFQAKLYLYTGEKLNSARAKINNIYNKLHGQASNFAEQNLHTSMLFSQIDQRSQPEYNL
eukprot:TRINITY_DN2498_c0_g1_i4.p1 TRINITY_DN2498_c0_g1~~TRINITY_DN2498_c0_g1_i4.p1  ORF type:complete len:599 (-),score=90.48 TRINITY_DN2498_c0_g1_i4:178-1974(-)